MEKRRPGLLAGIVIAALALAACSGEARPVITKQAATITLGIAQEPEILFAGIGTTMAQAEVLGAAQALLVGENHRAEFVPLAAGSKPTPKNGGARFVDSGTDKHLEVTFKIKPHNWQDGTPVTAEDARFGWLLFLDPKFPAGDRSLAEKLWDLQALDSKTIVAKFMSEAQALQASKGQHPVMKDVREFTDYREWSGRGPVVDPLYFTFGDFLLPRHILKDIPADKISKSDFASKPVYNGAYRVKEWVKGQQITLEAQDSFFLGTPKIKNMVFKIFKDASAEIAALRAGTIDVATQIGLELDDKSELAPLSDRFNVLYIPGPQWEHIDFNLSDPVTKDIHVRRAIAYGTNRKQIVDNLLFGKSEIANAFIPDWHPYFKPNKDRVVRYPYDPAKAESELKEAGYRKGSDSFYAKDGKPLKVKLQTTRATLRKQTAQLIQNDLKRVGIDLEMEFLVAKDFIAQNPPGPLRGRTFQLGLYTWQGSFDPDAEALYLGKNTPSKENAWIGGNFPGYRGADDLIQQADLIAENVVDESKRIQLYGDVLKRWTTDLPVLPLFLRVSTIAARKELKNFKPPKHFVPETWNSWEWEMPIRS
jgi:peptide/nickel transport system substrate-binding protein